MALSKFFNGQLCQPTILGETPWILRVVNVVRIAWGRLWSLDKNL